MSDVSDESTGWLESITPINVAFVDAKIDFTQDHPKLNLPEEVYFVAREMLWNAARISVPGRVITMPDIEVYSVDPDALCISWALKQRQLEIKVKVKEDPQTGVTKVIRPFMLWGPEIWRNTILTRFGDRREIDSEEEALELIKWVHCVSIYDPWFVKPDITGPKN